MAESLGGNASFVTGAELLLDMVGQEHGVFGLGRSCTALGQAISFLSVPHSWPLEVGLLLALRSLEVPGLL